MYIYIHVGYVSLTSYTFSAIFSGACLQYRNHSRYLCIKSVCVDFVAFIVLPAIAGTISSSCEIRYYCVPFRSICSTDLTLYVAIKLQASLRLITSLVWRCAITFDIMYLTSLIVLLTMAAMYVFIFMIA